jgi:L-lactate dehydrogenase complex protein LldG
MSRNAILSAIHQNKPRDIQNLPPKFDNILTQYEHLSARFEEVLRSIGGGVVYVKNMAEVLLFIQQHFSSVSRIINGLSTELLTIGEKISPDADPHSLANVDLAILSTPLGVAENGAIWLDDNTTPHRVLPMIAQHLIVILNEKNIVPTMHHAYDHLLEQPLAGFGAFVAGPSKTADIEQSLVIGAHGTRSMTVCIVID